VVGGGPLVCVAGAILGIMPDVAMEREPAVAGRFYPSDPRELAGEVASLLAGRPAGRAEAVAARHAFGVLSPHAGYVYSGAVAGATFARVSVPRRVIVLCPNHTGRGQRVAAWPGGAWRTPLGAVPVDEEMTREILEAGLATPDREAHRLEHALEVQLPFLQHRRPDLSIAAICLGGLSYSRCEEIGEGLARVAARHGALVVASSDMSHYVPAAVARAKDRLALDRLLALDARGLHEVVSREEISMCGFLPATIMVVAAVAQGAREAELVRYANSGEVTGDDGSVVGYAGVVLS
jgi:AmmeMemoRadiSam system protein B